MGSHSRLIQQFSSSCFSSSNKWSSNSSNRGYSRVNHSSSSKSYQQLSSSSYSSSSNLDTNSMKQTKSSTLHSNTIKSMSKTCSISSTQWGIQKYTTSTCQTPNKCTSKPWFRQNSWWSSCSTKMRQSSGGRSVTRRWLQRSSRDNLWTWILRITWSIHWTRMITRSGLPCLRSRLFSYLLSSHSSSLQPLTKSSSYLKAHYWSRRRDSENCKKKGTNLMIVWGIRTTKEPNTKAILMPWVVCSLVKGLTGSMVSGSRMDRLTRLASSARSTSVPRDCLTTCNWSSTTAKITATYSSSVYQLWRTKTQETWLPPSKTLCWRRWLHWPSQTRSNSGFSRVTSRKTRRMLWELR